jgi:putative oxidoreductase
LEVIGGIALLVGLVTRIASILLIIEMIGSSIVAKLSEGFVGGFELDLLLMSVAISLLLTGPGKISVEYDILKREIFPSGKKIVDKIKQHEKG